MPTWVIIVLIGMLAGLFLDHWATVIVDFFKRIFVGGPPSISPHFSPRGGCTEAIVKEIHTARREVLVQAYSFTSPEIAKALQAAAARKVAVTVLLDKSNERESYTELGDLTGHGMEVLIDPCHAIAHNKVILIDGRTVLTGSFNFTRQAEHENAENLLVLRHYPDLAASYRKSFHAHKGHCVKPGATPAPPQDHAVHARRGAFPATVSSHAVD